MYKVIHNTVAPPGLLCCRAVNPTQGTLEDGTVFDCSPGWDSDQPKKWKPLQFKVRGRLRSSDDTYGILLR